MILQFICARESFREDSIQPQKLGRVRFDIEKNTDEEESWNEEYIDITEASNKLHLNVPSAMSVPSENVVNILYAGQLIKHHNL